ncbi:hypothetical protein K523DRAFT_364068, partial [Schizophyllum commune Tattone D]
MTSKNGANHPTHQRPTRLNALRRTCLSTPPTRIDLTRGMASSSSSARDAVIAMAAKYSEGLPGYVDSSTLPRYITPASPSPPKYPLTVLLT